VLGVNGWEFLVLAVVALVVVGPDKLPKYAAEAGRFLRQMRAMAQQAQSDVREQLGPEFADLDVRDLDPRRFVQKHLFEDDPDGLRPEDFRFSLDDSLDDDNVPPARSPRHDRVRPGNGPNLRKAPDLTKPGAPPPFDADAT
jgi:sec-independent protein translocase protein TatB